MKILKLILLLVGIHQTSAIINIIFAAVATLQLLLNLNAPISTLTSFIASAGTAIGISNSADDVLFYYYPTVGQKIPIIFKDQASLIASGFNPNLPTIIITDGFLSNSISPMSLTLSASYPQKYGSGSGVNTIVTDWGALSGSQVALINVNAAVGLATYPIVITNVPTVGTRVAQFINFLGVNPSLVRLIGHSLGAHISGMAGDYAQKTYGVTYSRISGLDPAGPLYTGGVTLAPNQELSPGNAAYVDAYHTNRGRLGTTDTSNGHIDIVVNGGSDQPGCSVLDYPPGGTPGLGGLSGFCSHSYSWRIYNNTIFNDNKAGPCDASSPLSSCFSTTPPTGFAPTLSIGEKLPLGTTGKYSVYSTDAYTSYTSIVG